MSSQKDRVPVTEMSSLSSSSKSPEACEPPFEVRYLRFAGSHKTENCFDTKHKIRNSFTFITTETDGSDNEVDSEPFDLDSEGIL